MANGGRLGGQGILGALVVFWLLGLGGLFVHGRIGFLHDLCHFVGHQGAVETPVWNRASITPGMQIAGPAIVASEVTTFLVDPGWTFVAARQGASWFLRAVASH